MSKALYTINIHTLSESCYRPRFQAQSSQITYINYTSSQRQLKTGIPKSGILSPTLFNIYTADIPPHSSIYRLKYFYFYFFKSLQSVYTISCSLLNRAILTLNFYNQATRSKLTAIIVHTFIKHEQRRKY